MGMMRRQGFVFAAAMTALLALYIVFVAERAVVLIRAGGSVGAALGVALLILPIIGAWYLTVEWRLGTTVQRMADDLDEQGRLPIHDGDTDERGRLTEESAAAVFEVAKRGVEHAPEDWAAWFHVAYAYEANKDRSMARKSLRHAAELYRAQQRVAVTDE